MSALAALRDPMGAPGSGETRRCPTRALTCGRAAFSLPSRRFVVESESLEVLDHLRHVFAEFPVASNPPDHADVVIRRYGPGFAVEEPGAPPAYFSDSGRAADYLQLRASHAALSTVDQAVAVHAAGVSWDGRALLIAGPSGAGKSTLTAALLRRGCRYMSDEAVFLSLKDGLATGFPRAVGLAGGTNLVKQYHHASTLGATIERDRLPVAFVVVLDGMAPRRQDTSARLKEAGSLSPMSPAEALPALLLQVFAPGPADVIVDCLVRLVRSACVLRLNGGGPDQGAGVLFDLINSPAVQAESSAEHRLHL
jgi:hypothetical protein